MIPTPKTTQAMPSTPQPISIETFTRDLWGAMRDISHEQIGVRPGDPHQLPTWEQLSPEARHQKILLARDELLKPLDRAGYVVTKKKEEA
jgi:hypothetical protein